MTRTCRLKSYWYLHHRIPFLIPQSMVRNSDEFIMTLKELSVLLLQLERLNGCMEAEFEEDHLQESRLFSNETIASVKVRWWQLN